MTIDLRSLLDRCAAVVVISGHFATATAQDRPFVFQHGVLSSATTWDVTADSLRRRLYIVPVKPTLNWTRLIGSQATQLHNVLMANSATASATGIPFAAHSLGGLVSRQYDRGVTDNKIDRLITIASPHAGAPLAASWYNNNGWNGNLITQYGAGLANAIGAPIVFYDRNDWGRIPDFVYNYAGRLSLFARDLNGYMCGIAGFCLDDATNAVAPFVAQVVPNSAFLRNLNGEANLTREATTFGSGRLARYTTIGPRDALFRLFTDDTRRVRETRSIAIALYQGMYQIYADHENDYLRAHAGLWLEGEAAIIDIDYNWQRLIGANPRNYYVFIRPDGRSVAIHLDVDPSDGLLPSTSVAWQAADNARTAGNYAHTEQTNSPTIREAIRTAALNFGIAERPSTSVYSVTVGPNPAALTVGASRQLYATAYNVNGAVLSGKTFTWSSANANVATVSLSGEVSGVSPGQTTITAASEGYAGSASVAVGAMAASIAGPATVRSGTSCTWYANVVYGGAPYEYAWRVGTKPQPGTTDALTFQNVGSSFTITLTVTDTFGDTATGSKAVSISSSAPLCQ